MSDKRCSRCGETKPLDAFPVSRTRGELTRRSWCQECLRAYYQQRNRRLATGEIARGWDNRNIAPKGAGEPTEAMPGSPEKVAVLERRAAAGLNLWHPEDRPRDADR